MRIQTINIVRSFVVAVFILTLFVGLPAQIKNSKPRWNWRKHEAETIEHAKKYPVSDLDPKLSNSSFEQWFQKLLGDSAQFDWAVNDCGEQTGTAADRGRDFSMCVSARTQTAEFFYVSVNIQFGTFSSGISSEKPFVRSISVGDLLDGEMFYVLSDLPEKIRLNLLKRQYLDPNNGVFIISGEKPAGFKDFTAMRLQTMAENKNLKRVAVTQNGRIEIGQKEYVMREVRFDGQRLTFTTVGVGGVNFKFEGEFSKLEFDSDGKALGEDILKGRLTKFVKGKKAAAAKLTFSWIRTENKALTMRDKKV